MGKKKKSKSTTSVGSKVTKNKTTTSTRNNIKRKPTTNVEDDIKNDYAADIGSRNKNVKSGNRMKRIPRNNDKKKSKKKHSKLKKFIIILFLIIVLSILVAIGVFCGIFFSDKFALAREDLLLSNANTIIYDRDGNVIAELSGSENRKIISYDEMVKYIPDAFVAIEDERFYSHKGVDLKRTLAATTTYLAKGDSSFGGSTITQQLIKNITNERDNTGSAGVERKIKEMSRAYQVEKMISKKQILELYLNIIPLGADGGDICGVEMASTYYFNKSARDLSIEESAFLAGINNAPNTYNPFKNSEDAEKQAKVMNKIKTRTKTVLGKMKELKYISEEEYKTACQNTDNGLPFSKGNLPSSTIKDYFIKAAVDEVINDLVERKNMSLEYAKNRVYGGGYKIYTTENASVQTALKDVYTSGNYILTSSLSPTHSQSAMVIMDHASGQVVACMGGLGNDVDAIGLDRATVIPRQTGSSIKPIVTYGYGIESGTITAGTVYNDEKIYFGSYEPKNDSGGFSGYITVRNAIERSVNVVACKIMAELEPDNAIDFARKCGISTLVKSSENSKKNDSNIPAMALGGQLNGVTPLEMAAAYAMIANNGIYISPTFYTKVLDSAGNVVIETEQKTERVMTEQHAYIMKTLLKQPVEGGSGTAKVCRMDKFDVGAKTGTTNKKVDNWLCGMTPYYTAASWYGYDKSGSEPIPINGSGNNAAKLWAEVMKKVHESLPEARFTEPSGITKISICKKTGLKASSSCSDVYSEYMVEGEEPKTCDGHTSIKVCSESGKLATEFCPNSYYYSFLPEKERNPKWKTDSGRSSSAPSDTCTLHTQNTVTPVAPVEEDPGTQVTTEIAVPNVIGLTEAEALNKLSSLNVQVKTKSDSSKQNGVVLSQSIQPNDLVEKNAKIVITVNKIEKVEEPPVKNEIPTNNAVENKIDDPNPENTITDTVTVQ